MRISAKTGALIVIAGLTTSVVGCHHNRAVTISAPPMAQAPPPAAPPPPACTLTAEPSTTALGTSVVLSWTSSDATGLKLQPDLGTRLATGSTTVSPKDSTTYTLEVTGPSGSANCSARVTVTPAPSPPVAAKGTVKEETVEDDRTTLKDAFFDYDSAVLRPDAQQAFTEDANFLKAHPTINFTVEGHCDQRGSEEYNLALGDRRARAGSEFLIRLGIDSARVKAISYGKGRPRCTQGSEECWEINRRDHITLNRPESNP